MTDTPLTDMTSFFERHERRTRRAFVAMLSVSLILSAAIFARGALAIGAPGAVLADLWTPIAMGPLLIVALRIGGALYARQRLAVPDGRLLMGADDARNVARVANAGFVFVAGAGAVLIAVQAFWALQIFGVLQSLNMNSNQVVRAILLAFAALSIHFGNIWPRMPTSRAPEQNPAVRMKYNRFGGWLTVIFGVLLGLAALVLPFPALPPAVVVLGVSLLLATAAGAVMFRIALKSRSAS